MSPILLLAAFELTLHVGGGTIHVHGDDGLDEAHTRAWTERAASAVTAYFGAFPVKDVTLKFSVGGGVHGTTFGDPARIFIDVAPDFDDSDDWVLTHEMVHLALPNLPRAQHWLEEGSATFVEPAARAAIGNRQVSGVWAEWLRDMHQGEPEKGDRGLDRTPTWARTYWGGALFCLVADVKIREASGGKQSLADVFRGIRERGGNINVDWSMEKLVAAGDAATGTHVLGDWYAENRSKPVTVDLPALWKRLGVSNQGGKITYDDTAPLAEIRKAMVVGPRN